jgi:hypothetical protein
VRDSLRIVLSFTSDRQLGGCCTRKTELPAATAQPLFRVMPRGLTARALRLLVPRTLDVVYSGLSGTRHLV